MSVRSCSGQVAFCSVDLQPAACDPQDKMVGTRYLCVLYVATAGQQGQRLGLDEEEVVLLIYLIVDVAVNKVSRVALTSSRDCTVCCSPTAVPVVRRSRIGDRV